MYLQGFCKTHNNMTTCFTALNIFLWIVFVCGRISVSIILLKLRDEPCDDHNLAAISRSKSRPLRLKIFKKSKCSFVWYQLHVFRTMWLSGFHCVEQCALWHGYYLVDAKQTARQSGHGTRMDWAQQGFRDLECGHEMTKAKGLEPLRSVPHCKWIREKEGFSGPPGSVDIRCSWIYHPLATICTYFSVYRYRLFSSTVNASRNQR